MESLLVEAGRVAPILHGSMPVGSGFLKLSQDPDTLWVTVDGPAGSAVVVFASPSSDTNLLFKEVMLPFESLSQPFSRQIISQGSTEQPIAELLDTIEIVPVSESPIFHALGEPELFPVMPISVRRAARSWRRLAHNLYVTSLAEPAASDVYLSRSDDGAIELLTYVGDGQAPAWVDGLVSRGTHRIQYLDPAAVVAKPLRMPVTEDELVAQAQELVGDVQHAFAASQLGAPAFAAPLASGPWERIDGVFRAAAGRAWQPPLAPNFGFIERVRESVEGVTTFESTNALATWLQQQRGTGFEHAWRGPDDQLISPPWLTVKSAVVDNTTGHVVAAGHFTHHTWDLHPAHDIGAIDGRNGIYGEEGYPGGLFHPALTLYVGSMRSGVFLPLDATLNVIAVDLNPINGEIAVFSMLDGSSGAVSVISANGEKHIVTVLDGLIGNEVIRYSGDGHWLLIPGSSTSKLVDLRTGCWLTIDVGNTTWWPLADSTLLSIHHREGIAFPTLFSLSENAFKSSFPQITLDEPLLETYPYVWFPDVSADGSEILAVSAAGVTVEYQGKHGAGSHLVRFNVETGRGAIVQAPFLNHDGTLERDVSDVRWHNARANVNPVTLHSALSDALHQPLVNHDALSADRWATEAEQILVLSLNTAIRRTQEGAGSIENLLPEILASLVPLGHSSDAWQRQSEWLRGLRDATANMIESGSLTGEFKAFWQEYVAAISAIEAGSPDLINPIWSPVDLAVDGA
jgi:hypothetical protein